LENSSTSEKGEDFISSLTAGKRWAWRHWQLSDIRVRCASTKIISEIAVL
jgi:hypothetical protein